MRANSENSVRFSEFAMQKYFYSESKNISAIYIKENF
jgi:hypothetical protein